MCDSDYLQKTCTKKYKRKFCSSQLFHQILHENKLWHYKGTIKTEQLLFIIVWSCYRIDRFLAIYTNVVRKPFKYTANTGLR